MKIIYSSILPFKGFRAINLFGIVFARKEFPPLTREIENHERIHSQQILELLVVFFYAWYVVEWMIRWAYFGNRMEAYRNISFEREAHQNDHDLSYLKKRKPYQFLHYLRKNKT